MEYLYCFANASLTLRVVERIRSIRNLPIQFVTVIHQIDGWVVRIKTSVLLPRGQDLDLRAFLAELGIPYQPGRRIRMALWSLELGEPPVQVMRTYQVAVVSHGCADSGEIEEFRRQFISGLGYCPATLT
jgi:hypothetical protein